MSSILIRAASILRPDGFASTTHGVQPWRNRQGEVQRRLNVSDLAWASVLSSPCPRFGRMDMLSRIGLMAVELLNIDFEHMDPAARETVGVCMTSCYGSLSTDVDFYLTSSPSIFVYTLPSATIGEICIRHRLKGPIHCLMPTGRPGRQAIEEAVSWLDGGEASAGVCVYCDVMSPNAAAAVKSTLDHGGDFWYACALYLERDEGGDTAGGRSLSCDDTGIVTVDRGTAGPVSGGKDALHQRALVDPSNKQMEPTRTAGGSSARR